MRYEIIEKYLIGRRCTVSEQHYVGSQTKSDSQLAIIGDDHQRNLFGGGVRTNVFLANELIPYAHASYDTLGLRRKKLKAAVIDITKRTFCSKVTLRTGILNLSSHISSLFESRSHREVLAS